MIGYLLHDAVDGISNVLSEKGKLISMSCTNFDILFKSLNIAVPSCAKPSFRVQKNNLKLKQSLPRGDQQRADDEDDEGGLVVEAEDVVVDAHRVELDQPLDGAEHVKHGASKNL